MSLRSILKAAAPLAVLATAILLQSVPAQAAGDPVRGKTLGYTCLGCHGIETYKNVYPTFSVPKLRGQSAEYIVEALKAYRGGDRSHGTMHAHASSLSDADMQDLAAYLGGTSHTYDADAKPKGTPPAALALCNSCHGPVGVGLIPTYPSLAGQHADYLAHAIESYRSGARKNGIMAPFASQLQPADIAAIAKFYSQQQPALVTVPIKEKAAK
jgi:cytochrome c553